MAEETKAPVSPRVQIASQFMRDLSFENIAVQKGVDADGKPDLKFEVGLDAKKRGDDRFEVAIKFKANSTVEDKPVFILEIDYAGLFVIQNVPEEQMHPFLLIECPRLLFPYLRRIVGDITRDGGYPPLNLEPIDFMAMYRNNLARQQAEANKNLETEPPAGNA